MKKLNTRIECADGARVSIQASRTHYCEPRDDEGPYYLIEAGYPSVAPPEPWLPYAEDLDRLTDTVYGYMPTALVAEFIVAHGGKVAGELPEVIEGRGFDGGC